MLQTAHTKDGKEGTIDLTKVDGKWKVSNYPKEMVVKKV